jgi:hypothetical protein
MAEQDTEGKVAEAGETLVYCYRDATRPCTAECVAFLGETSRPSGEFPGAIASCSLLVDSHRSGKHLTILAQQGNEALKHWKITGIDRRNGR